MRKKEYIPLHLMEDWPDRVYLKSFAAAKDIGPAYELSEPHRHDFYYCVLLEAGEMQLEVDLQRIRLAEHSLFFSYPGQVHRICSARLDRGWFLAFDPSLIDQPLKDIVDQCLSEVMVLTLNEEKLAALSALTGHLAQVYQSPAEQFRQQVVRSLVNAFGYQLASAYLLSEQAALAQHNARSVEITKRFKQQLRQHFRSVKRPAAFASSLNLSVGHLNDTVKAVTGFSVTCLIQQEAIREAQRLLRYSDLSVKEIAQALGFDDAQYFSRLFRKVAGVAPATFKKGK